MKANTSSDLIADYKARGGIIVKGKTQRKLPKHLTYRSGNHILLPKERAVKAS